MPRQLRLEYAGAIYHVMSSGDGPEVIVRDSRDRERFLTTLGEACLNPVRAKLLRPEQSLRE